ncbi:MAG: metallophosphoesterase [Myxococcales bacterium]|nr:metallophosphoesterase [Myxococcales bacterium]MCB9704064.1 metallophosphoesterase [Myxococcales bacterium]
MLRRSPRILSTFAASLLTLAACGDDSSVSTSDTESASASASTTNASASAGSTSDGGSSGDASGSASMSASGTSTSTTSTSAGTTTGDPSTSGPATTTGVETTGGSSGGSGTTTGGVDQVVRFIVLGDTGEGNEDQYSVGQAIVEICAQKGCDFAVMTGDNFYDSGVKGVDDPQWQDKFEMPYEDFTFPVYAVLGNHDYGGSGIGVDLDGDKPDYQVAYTQVSDLWNMPSKYYSFGMEHVDFWFLDTNQVMTDPFNGNSDTQKNWLKNELAQSSAAWKIGFGHHPYISNGDHGNAGAYENLEGIPFPFVTGTNVKKFMDEALCGKIDVYICGHDHNLQWLEPKCGTEHIVSGAGSKAEPLPGSNPFFFQKPDMEGFIWVEIAGDQFTGTFYDKNAGELFTRTFMK